MKRYWKVIIGICSLILLVIIVNLGINLWIKYQLPKIINRENDSTYFITYKNLNVSLLHRNIKAEEIVIIPKAALKDTINKDGIYAQVKSVEVQNFKIWNLLFSDKLQAKSITIQQPKVILYQKNEKEEVRNSVVGPFEKIINVSDVFINHGDLHILHIKDNKAVLSVSNINLNIDGIVIDEKILKEKIPFKFSNYKVSCDSLYYHPNQFYHIKTKKIKTSKTDLKIDHFEMLQAIPEKLQQKFQKKRYIHCFVIQLLYLKLIGVLRMMTFFHCNTIDLNHAAANIYRSKEPADDLTKKYLYNKLLRDTKFDLKVDTLKVRNSILEYEEEKSFEVGSGKLTFNNFNLTATSICSGFKKVKLPDLKIKINCQFMNASPFVVNWKFNVMDKTDGFNINGTLTNFDVENIVTFTKPYLNVTTKGILEEVHFNFTGNDKSNSGELAVKYDDLKFTVYKKDDRKKKNKLLTLVAKIFVKKDTKDKVKNAHIEVERIPEKSFYNFLWISIAEGLKKILV